MNLSAFRNAFDRIGNFAQRHAPEILAGIGIGGFITSTVLAVKATPEAVSLIEDKKEELGTEELSAVETVKTVWKPYAPAVLTGACSTLCVIGSVSTSLRRNAALATAYEITRNFADEYKAKVVETFGEKKEKKMREAISQDQVDKNPPVTGANLVPAVNDGEHRLLFFESITKRYFWARRTDVDKAINKFFKEVKNSWSTEYSVYSWLTLLRSYGIKIMDGFPDGEVDKYMDLVWETSNMFESDLVEAELHVCEIHGGEWDGYSCFKIEYSIEPSPIIR